MSDEAVYPEHERMIKVKPQAEIIGEFLEWLEGQEVVLAHWREDDLEPAGRTLEQWLAAYFDIDLKKITQEKDAMLQEAKRRNAIADIMALREELA